MGLRGPFRHIAKGDLATRMRSVYDEQQYASIIFFETPSGGAVFSVGSMAYTGSLNHDGFNNGIVRMTGNVLRRFSQPQGFRMPV